jgi:4'-phosphopantetheinyl transferase
MSALAIHLCPLTALDDTLRQRYRDTLLDDEEQARLTHLTRALAADQFLLGRALLRTALGEQLGRDPRSLRLQRNADGKPALFDADGWHFNLSHSRDWVALALSRDGEIGIDVESSERRNDIDGIARRFFRPEESAWLQTLPEAHRRCEFFRIWTLKEATVKALGRGIADTLIDVGVQIEGDTARLQLHGSTACSPAPRHWHFTFDAQRYHLAVVVLPASRAEIAMPPRLIRHLPLRDTQPLAIDDLFRTV